MSKKARAQGHGALGLENEDERRDKGTWKEVVGGQLQISVMIFTIFC